MLISFIGPPGSGKSQTASRFVIEYPEFYYADIAAYRRHYWNREISAAKNEEQIWQRFRRDIPLYQDILVESCGIQHQIIEIVNNSNQECKLTILFNINRDLARQRVRDRQKKYQLPKQFSASAELETIDYAIDNLEIENFAGEKALVTIEEQETKDEVYEKVKNLILTRRK